MKSLIFAACVVLSMPNLAWAVRECKSTTSDGSKFFVATLSGFKPPPFSPGDIPIGGVIYSATGGPTISNKKPGQASVECNYYLNVYIMGMGFPGADGIYPTSVPNVGMRLTVDNGTPVPYRHPYSQVNWSWNETFPIKIELIKTGNITAPGTLTGGFAQYRANNESGELFVELRFAAPVAVTPKVPTCTVATPQVPVRMGQMQTRDFTGVGTTTPARTFDISLTCSGGDAGTSTNAYMTLTDATMPGNRSTTLSLATDSKKASGVGLQVLRDGIPLGFGPDSSAAGNPNQWYVGTIPQGQRVVTIPLSARYVQTEEKIVPGIANAVATFTMSYQ